MTTLENERPAHDTQPVSHPRGSTGMFELERASALFVVALSGMRIQVFHGITLGLVLGALLTPVWIREVRRHGRFAIWLVSLGSVALVWGVLLSWNSSSTHQIDFRQAVSFLAFLMQFIVGAGVMWWARRVLPVRLIAAVFGLAILAQGLLTGAEHTANPWKTLIAVPLAILLLGLCLDTRRRRLFELGALAILTVASAFLDSRSYAASFFISALLVGWQMRPRTMTKSRSIGLTTAMLAALVYGAYLLGQNLLVAGYLGAGAQARTVAQIQQGGSLIYGGRPELKATLALMHDDPWGHGVGVLPTFHDVRVAKDALSGVLYNPNNGYVDNFMFGNDIELHSIFGDLWSHFGIAGIGLVLLIALQCIHMVVGRVNERRASGLVLYLGLWNLWNVLFSPFYSSVPTLILMFGLLDEKPLEGDGEALESPA
jgi:hypothetical protein